MSDEKLICPSCQHRFIKKESDDFKIQLEEKRKRANDWEKFSNLFPKEVQAPELTLWLRATVVYAFVILFAIPVFLDIKGVLEPYKNILLWPGITGTGLLFYLTLHSVLKREKRTQKLFNNWRVGKYSSGAPK